MNKRYILTLGDGSQVAFRGETQVDERYPNLVWLVRHGCRMYNVPADAMREAELMPWLMVALVREV
jgi:hypothetical protein